MNATLHKAMAYAREGWRVFPCGRDKKPLVKAWPKVASTDPEQIQAWWGQWPTASIGCPTGPSLGKNGAWVLDVDLPDGPATLAALEAKHGPLPSTVEQKTGGGGRQLFYKWAEGREVRNTAGERGKLGAGLDVRGVGGYVILPPSGHPSGGVYAWSGNGTPLADAPEWLLDLVAPLPKPEAPKPPMTVPTGSAGTTPYGRKALEEEAAKVAGTGQGGRNHALNQAAFLVGQLVAGGELDRGESEAALMAAAGQCGLSDAEARQTIGSGFKAGEKEPRQAPEAKWKRRRVQAAPGASNFVSKGSGVFYLAQDENGGVNLEWLCSPLHVQARTRDEDGMEWGRLLEVVDADGQAKRWAMPMSLLKGSGDDLRGELLSMGLDIAPGLRARNRLHEYLTTARPDARARCVSRVGWHGRRFVLPDGVHGYENGEEVILQGGPADHAFRTAGSLREWQDAIGQYCPGNSRLVLAVSIALAAPLLALAGGESGGFHLVGLSSGGKTTVLKVAGSVCGGGGLSGYIRTWRATDNALEGTALTHCDTLLCLDEMGQVDAKTAAATAYMISNGQGKGRARQDGTGRKPKSWRTLFLSTGEITLADKIQEDGKARAMAGQAVRVVDIPADGGSGLGVFENIHGFESSAAFARHLGEVSARVYGAPLRDFLEKLTGQFDEGVQAAPEYVKRFVEEVCPSGADGQVMRVAGRFGLVAAAGEFGTALGVLPWPENTAREAAARCFGDWLEARGGTCAAEVTGGLAQVRQFFQAHGASRFETWGEPAQDAKTINRAGFRRKDEASGEWSFYVFQDVFKGEICKSLNAAMVLRELKTRGLLLISEADRNTVKPCIPGTARSTRFYHLAPGIIGGEEKERSAENYRGQPGAPGEPHESLLETAPGEQAHTGSTGSIPALKGISAPACPRLPKNIRGHSGASIDAMPPVAPAAPGQNINAGHVPLEPRHSRVVL
jgi:uncharacterized protein (DUF927 family)